MAVSWYICSLTKEEAEDLRSSFPKNKGSRGRQCGSWPSGGWWASCLYVRLECEQSRQAGGEFKSSCSLANVPVQGTNTVPSRLFKSHSCISHQPPHFSGSILSHYEEKSLTFSFRQLARPHNPASSTPHCVCPCVSSPTRFVSDVCHPAQICSLWETIEMVNKADKLKKKKKNCQREMIPAIHFQPWKFSTSCVCRVGNRGNMFQWQHWLLGIEKVYVHSSSISRERNLFQFILALQKKGSVIGLPEKNKMIRRRKIKEERAGKKRKAEQSFPPQGILLKAICSPGDGVQRKFWGLENRSVQKLTCTYTCTHTHKHPLLPSVLSPSNLSVRLQSCLLQ